MLSIYKYRSKGSDMYAFLPLFTSYIPAFGTMPKNQIQVLDSMQIPFLGNNTWYKMKALILLRRRNKKKMNSSAWSETNSHADSI